MKLTVTKRRRISAALLDRKYEKIVAIQPNAAQSRPRSEEKRRFAAIRSNVAV
jgi:hypothetical protein